MTKQTFKGRNSKHYYNMLSNVAEIKFKLYHYKRGCIK